MDGGGSSVGIGVGGHLRLHDISHAQGAFPALDMVLNRHIVDRHALTDQAGNASKGTTQITTKGVEESFPLLWRGFVINVKHGTPVAVQDVAGYLIDLDEREVRDIHAPHLPPINVVGIDRVALPTVWIVAHPAGARPSAGTGLQQGPIQNISLLRICLCCHCVFSLCDCCFHIERRVQRWLFQRKMLTISPSCHSGAPSSSGNH